jgi:hypothetical protein
LARTPRLTPTLDSPSALLRKLEREAYRAFHASRPVHQADHFYNFCVTAHAMRDHVMENLGHTSNKSARDAFHTDCNTEPLLVTVGEIANATKHFVLRYPDGQPRPMRTRSVRPGTGRIVHVFRGADGTLRSRSAWAPDILVRVSDGRSYPLWLFTQKVIDKWRTILRARGIRTRRESIAQLSGA